MNDGTYEESLNCGGTLKVTRTSWRISYYFSGPDLRYNGTFFDIPGANIDSYISAFIQNWAEYENLKTSIPLGGTFTKAGLLGMSIQIGGFRSGICIKSYHMPISTKADLEKVIAAYRYAKERAPQIQAFLKSI